MVCGGLFDSDLSGAPRNNWPISRANDGPPLDDRKPDYRTPDYGSVDQKGDYALTASSQSGLGATQSPLQSTATSHTPMAPDAKMGAKTDAKMGAKGGSSDVIDPSRANAGADRWRRALAAHDGAEDAAALDDPRRLLSMLKVFGSTRRLADLCLQYPSYAAKALKEGPAPILAEAARDLSALSMGIGGADALHGALAPIKSRTDIAIGISEIAGDWTTSEANAARTDLGERFVETALAWLVRGAASRGELVLENDDLSAAGVFALAGGDFAHEDLAPYGPADLLVVYDTAQFDPSRARMAERAFVRIGAELREALEGKPGEYPILSIRSPLGQGINGQGLVECRERLCASLDTAPMSLAKRWIAASRVVAGDRKAAGEFLEKAEEIVWGEEPALSQEARAALMKISPDPRAPFDAIATLLRWGLGRSRPVFRTTSTRVVIETAAAAGTFGAGALSREQADRLAAGADFTQKIVSRIQTIKGIAAFETATDDEHAALAALMGFADFDSFQIARNGAVADARNALSNLLSGAQGEFALYQSESQDPDDIDKLEDLGFKNGAGVSSLIDGWAELCSKGDNQRFSAIAPGLLTAFGETQNPNEAALLFDKFIRVSDNSDELNAVAGNPDAREPMIRAFGCFGGAVEPLTEDASLASMLNMEAGEETPGAAHEYLARFAPPRENSPEAIGAWRRAAIARTAYCAAAEVMSFDAVADILAAVGETSLARTFDGAMQELKSPVKISLYAISGSDNGLPGAAAPIGFVSEQGERDDTEKAARLFLDRVSALGDGFFAVNPDVSRRPGGMAGPLAPTVSELKSFIQSEAIAADHMAMARSKVIAGADDHATKALRTAVSSPRRADILLRDIDRTRAQRLRRDRAGSLWDIDQIEGGLSDVELIISTLIYRHAAAQPALQTEAVDDALDIMARAGILGQDVADTLKSARRFWIRLKTVKALARWTDPDRTPVRRRFADLIARAAEVESFGAVKPMMRGYSEEVTRLYAQLVLGRPSIGLIAQ